MTTTNVVGETFYNQREPDFTISHEKPEHRIILYLKGQGLTHTEIAAKTGYTIPWISQICRQPWFVSRLASELDRAGQDYVAKAISSNAPAAIEAVVDLMNNADSAEIRAKCAFNLLDRYLGKPTQRTESVNSTKITYEDITGIDAELQQVNEELKKLGTT